MSRTTEWRSCGARGRAASWRRRRAPRDRRGALTSRARRALAFTLLVVASGAAKAAVEPPEVPPPAAAPSAERVRELLRRDLWREALEEARKLERTAPRDVAARAALGEALFRAGELEEADVLLTELAGRESLTGRGSIALGRLRAARGRVADAAALGDRAVVLAPEDPWVRFWAAELCLSREEKIGHLERYLELSAGTDEDRDEAARGTLRVLRELAERPIWVPVRRPPRLEISLRPVGGGDGWPLGYVVPAEVGLGGKPIRLLLDTGSGGLFLVRRKVRKREFEPLARETVFGGGGRRRHETERGLFPRFALGELSFAHALATLARHELDPRGRFHGVMGIDVFDGYKVVLDLEGQRLRLEPADGDASGEPYWNFSGQILVRVRVVGGKSGLFLLDTGATRSILADSLVAGMATAPKTAPSVVRGFGGQVRGARRVRGVELAFQQARSGGGELGVVDLSLRSRLGGVEISGYLGLDALDGTRIVIDTVRRRVAVSRTEVLSGFSPPRLRGRAGPGS